MDTFRGLDQVIKKNLRRLRKRGVLTVRPGYRMVGGWITKQPAIVVTVEQKRKRVAPQQALPSRLDGFPVDVREATPMQRLRHANPGKHATLVALGRPEYAEPEFPFERDVKTGKTIETGLPRPAAGPSTAVPMLPYTPAPGVLLSPVSATMSITFCASPDAGWIELSGFLRNIQQQLTVGMYDFTSAHVLQAVESGLSKGQNLTLVLDHPAPNPTEDQTDEQTEAALGKELGARQQFAWAAEAFDPKVTKAFFPNAYHIKVAVKDHTSFWLSSGNWNNSNQPNINPFPKSNSQIDAIAKKSDRDWHVIVQHPGLA